MAELTDDQMKILSQRFASVINNEQLQMELIDHCCCLTEEFMDHGVAFNDALDQALQKLAPGGIHEIEEEVNHALNPQISEIMKTTLYFSGFLAAFCILIGIMMRMLHWPGANVLLITGDTMLIFAMVFVLIQTGTRLPTLSRPSLLRAITGASGGILIGFGSAFKIMHWPMASILFVIGVLIITFVFLPIFFWQMYQREIKIS